MDKEAAFKKWIGEFHYEEDVQDAFFNGFEMGQSCTFEWQPIETAPRDGTRILLYRPTAMEWSRLVFGKYEQDKYAKNPRPYFRTDLERLWGVRSERENQPTHWMPLPNPPEKMEQPE